MKESKQAVVLGAGGHAKVVVATLQACGWNVAAALDDDRARHGQRLLGVPIRGPLDQLRDWPGAAAVVAIGDNAARRRVAESREATWLEAIHPGAHVHPTVQVGAGTVIFAGAVVQPETTLGRHVIVNTGATLDHDCVLGDFVHVAPGVHAAGGVRVGAGAFIGTGASLVPNVRIGANAIIGAGSVVLADVPDAVTAAGSPARIIKERGP